MNATSPERIRQDSRLIGQTLLKLALPRLIIRAGVLVVAAIIWLLVALWLLNFGRGLSFEGLQAFGPQVIEVLTRVNPYLWWGIVVIWTLIVFFAVRAWMTGDIAATRAKPIEATDLSALTSQLSDEVTNVLRWVWGSREEPFTLGDLRQASIEVRHSRIDKIDLVRQQSRILDTSTPPQSSARTPPVGSPAPTAEPKPVVVPPDPRSTGGRIEPNL